MIVVTAAKIRMLLLLIFGENNPTATLPDFMFLDDYVLYLSCVQETFPFLCPYLLVALSIIIDAKKKCLHTFLANGL